MEKSPPTTKNKATRKLLECLVCPYSKEPLLYDAKNQELISRASDLAYPIIAGTPILKPEKARMLENFDKKTNI